jgi:hypothetical protein
MLAFSGGVSPLRWLNRPAIWHPFTMRMPQGKPSLMPSADPSICVNPSGLLLFRCFCKIQFHRAMKQSELMK